MIKTLKNAFKIPDLRRKMLITLALLFVYRLGSFISIPFINAEAISAYVQGNSMFGLLNIISGNNFAEFSIFAMGIVPYINASIIMNLLTIAIPYLENLQKSGEEGRKRIEQYTRYLTLALAIVQALALSINFSGILTTYNAWTVAMVVLVATTGTAFLMWLGEKITELGVGNGISLLIFVGIIATLPDTVQSLYAQVSTGAVNVITVILFLVFAFLVIMGVVAVNEGERRIPIQYAKRQVGRKVYGGRNTFLPLKVNQTGVIPIIFASTVTMFPGMLASFFPNSGFWVWMANAFQWGNVLTSIIYVLLILLFTYFYTVVTFNPEDISDNMQQYGGVIPGIRPGKSTVDYLKKVLNRLTLSGAIFLAIIAVLPIVIGNITGFDLQFGGTTLLIIVGVALETTKQLEQQMVIRNYKGFLD